MWPRVVEVMMGCWLAMSPFIFNHPPDDPAYWIADWTAAVATITLAVLSFWTPLRRAHLGIVAVACGLIGFAYFYQGYPAPPALQNDLLVGLLLVMFAVIPGHASRPPESWEAWEIARAEQRS